MKGSLRMLWHHASADPDQAVEFVSSGAVITIVVSGVKPMDAKTFPVRMIGMSFASHLFIGS